MFTGDHVEYIDNERVSANFFHVLGVHPLLGREFTRAEDVSGGPPLAILSYSLWQRVFHGDPHVTGRTIELRGLPCTVIGVMPAGFVPPSQTIDGSEAHVDVWTPLHPKSTGEGSGSNYEIIGRLKPGSNYAEVNGQLNSIMHDLFARMKQPRLQLRRAGYPVADRRDI